MESSSPSPTQTTQTTNDDDTSPLSPVQTVGEDGTSRPVQAAGDRIIWTRDTLTKMTKKQLRPIFDDLLAQKDCIGNLSSNAGKGRLITEILALNHRNDIPDEFRNALQLTTQQAQKDLMDKVTRTYQARLKPATVKERDRKYRQIIAHIKRVYSAEQQQQLLIDVGDEETDAMETHLIFPNFTARVFTSFLESVQIEPKSFTAAQKKKYNNSGWPKPKFTPKVGSLKVYLTAVKHYAAQVPASGSTSGFVFPPEWLEAVAKWYESRKKANAEDLQKGVRVRNDKCAMPVAVYSALAKAFSNGFKTKKGKWVKANARDWSFLTTQWVLMQRSVTVGHLSLSSLKVVADGVEINPTKTKTNQTGDRDEARVCMCNPKNPERDNLLALAAWVAMVTYNPEIPDSHNQIYPAGNPMSTFSSHLRIALESQVVQPVAARYGYTYADFNTHALRKGAATSTTSASPVGNYASTCIRAGWVMGTPSTYLKRNLAGDALVARKLVGLPVDSIGFLQMAPDWVQGTPSEVRDECVKEVFASVLMHNQDEKDGGSRLMAVLRSFLANLLYHLDWIEKSKLFPDSSPLFSEKCRGLKRHVFAWDGIPLDGDIPDDDPRSKLGDKTKVPPSGIPPQIMMEYRLRKENFDLATKLQTQLQRHSTQVMSAIGTLVKEQASFLAKVNEHVDTVQMEAITTLFRNFTSGIHTKLNDIELAIVTQSATNMVPAHEPLQPAVRQTAGHVPKPFNADNFTFPPKMGVKEAFMMYYLPTASVDAPALKTAKLRLTKSQKRLSVVRTSANWCEKELQTVPTTVVEVAKFTFQAKEILAKRTAQLLRQYETEDRLYVRRSKTKGDMSITTFITKVRLLKKLTKFKDKSPNAPIPDKWMPARKKKRAEVPSNTSVLPQALRPDARGAVPASSSGFTAEYANPAQQHAIRARTGSSQYSVRRSGSGATAYGARITDGQTRAAAIVTVGNQQTGQIRDSDFAPVHLELSAFDGVD